jgi:hypothetical protein
MMMPENDKRFLKMVRNRTLQWTQFNQNKALCMRRQGYLTYVDGLHRGHWILTGKGRKAIACGN